MPSTALRTTRAVPGANRMPRTSVVLHNPGPTIATSDTSSTSAGNEIQTSTTRCTDRSSHPPKYADETPTTTATTVLISTAPNPIVIETRAPQMTRLSRSRPLASVPNGCASEGP